MQARTKQCSPWCSSSGLGLLLVALLGSGCASTQLKGVWKAPDPGPKVSRVLVIALTRSETGRRTVERQFASRLQAAKAQPFESNRFESGQPLDRAKVEELVKRENFDSVLLVRLVDVHQEEHYVPGGYAGYYGPAGGGFYGYYGYAYPMAYSPGYVSQSTTVQVETQLYRTQGQGQLVWSTVSETLDPSNVESAASGIANAVVERLHEDKLL
ncbi:hypothetical protein FGE12_11955 [Aggregicoccus sp. 17bor-14]|uniref:hypothetical protein n=1 Tax=Myxococcaceae TaxID=31 RepID=UPI00129CFE4F|nr:MULTISPECIES: hypothetical protein [Myxococcaceae]MBF5043103.1 hypothetical protein [Simulacricoccus sp. 17bor-14]MRI88865.1 hypothetical protein [Aggregicoccus sp. 17bor-14]